MAESFNNNKIGDIVAKALAELDARDESKQDQAAPFAFSLEYFPPRTTTTLSKLYERWWEMCKQGAQFADITWGAGGTTSGLTMQMSADAAQRFGFQVNMHLTCTNLPAEKVHEALKDARAAGIRSICALRGDPPNGQEAWEAVEGGFACGKDLIEFVRKEYGDFFGVSCSGYPEGHPASFSEVPEDYEFSQGELQRRVRLEDKWWVCKDADFERELAYLKEKVNAGADVIITQLFYSAEVFESFVKRCREIDIQVPILPGIMPINGLGPFKRMTTFCKTRIPEKLRELVASHSEQRDADGNVVQAADDEGFRVAGMDYVKSMCKELLAAGHRFLHFYTMNLVEPTYDLLSALGIEPNREIEFSEEQRALVAEWSQECGKALAN